MGTVAHHRAQARYSPPPRPRPHCRRPPRRLPHRPRPCRRAAFPVALPFGGLTFRHSAAGRSRSPTSALPPAPEQTAGRPANPLQSRAVGYNQGSLNESEAARICVSQAWQRT